MDFRVLGPLEVEGSHGLVRIRGAKQRALLGLLLVQANRLVSRDRLIDELWGDHPPATAKHTLEVYVSRLRRALAAGGNGSAIETRAGGYRLRVADGELDLLRFERLLEEGRSELDAGALEEAEESLAAALGLWRGPALVDLGDEPFSEVERQRLEELRLAGLEARLEVALRLGHDAELVGELQSLVADHPFDERLRAQLMLALYRSGRQADALATYREGRSQLVDELGMEPGSELQQLQQAILRHDPTLAPPTAQPPAPTTPTPAAASAANAQPPKLGEERKVVTVLFFELVGPPDLNEQTDPEWERQTLRRELDAVERVIVGHGGVAEKAVGYGQIGLFGLPAAHEDDALRAVRATTEIAELLPALAEETGVPLAMRAGINTGEVLARGAETPAAGATVRGAVHLQQLADPGEILLAPDTVRLLGAAVEVEPLRQPTWHGAPEPQAGFRLRRLVGAVRQERLLFVGREQELELLQGALRRAGDERELQLFTLLGAAGIGKSRLAAEFEASLGTRARIVHGRCLSYGQALSFWPLVEVLRELGEPAEGARERLVSGGASSPQELAWTVQRALEAAAGERPLLVVLEDLHWAEPPLLDLLDQVCELSRGAPILLLCLARPELLDRRPTWAGGKANAASLMLEPLSRVDSEMLCTLARPLEPAQRDRVVELAAGNPLFVEELTHFLAEGGSERQLPPRIQALLQARLDLLEESQRLLLGCAAVEGTVFHRSGLERLLPEQLAGEVPSQLTALQRTWLIRPGRSELAGEQAYRFRHQLIRDTAYAAMPKQERARLHERLSDWLGEHRGGRPELDDLAAYHLEQAALYRSELGAADPGLEARAAEALAAAAERAKRRADLRAAADLWQRALALLAGDDRHVPELELSLALVLPWLGRFDETQQLLEHAISQTADPAVVAAARLCALGAQLHSAPEGVPAAIRQECATAIPLFQRAADHTKLALAWTALGEAEFLDLQVEAAARAWTTAATEARLAGDRALEMTIRGMETDRVGLERMPVSALADELGRIADEYPGEPLCEITRDSARGMVAYQQGRHAEGRALFEAAIAKAHRIGQMEFASVHRAVGIPASEWSVGNLDEAERQVLAGIDELQEQNEHIWLAWAMTVLGEIRVDQGREEEALELADEADRQSPHERRIVILGNVVRARAHAQRGAGAAAKAAAAEAVAAARTTDSTAMHYRAQGALAAALAASGDLEPAFAAAREAASLCQAMEHNPWAGRLLALAEQIETAIAARRGEPTKVP